MFTGRAPIAQPPGNETSARAEARKQRTEHDDRSAHGAHELIWRDAFANRRSIDLHTHPVVDRDAHAHAAEQFDHRCNVVQMRDVADGDGAFGEQRRGENRQCGVLCAGDADVAFERSAAVYGQFVHG